MEIMDDIRYYMGRHQVRVIARGNKKQLVQHLEEGYTGNKREGYKLVKIGERDIVMIRNCWRIKDESVRD